MSMNRNSDKDKLILENQKLVRYWVHKMGVNSNSSDYEDIVSIGTIGLLKAASTFDETKKATFATYASRCINNEIFMHYRKVKKYEQDISMDEPILEDMDGNKITLGDMIADPESNFVEKIINDEEFSKVVSIVLNCLKGKERIVFLYFMANYKEKAIGEKLNISQCYANRLKGNAINKIKNPPVNYKEVFFMKMVGDKYIISFSSNDVENFNNIFAVLLQKIKEYEKLLDFKVDCNSERIIIQLPAYPESFAFIAQVIQEIDNFRIKFGSNKTMKSADDMNSQSDIDSKNI